MSDGSRYLRRTAGHRDYEEQDMRAARLGRAILKRLPVDTNRLFFGNQRKLSELGGNHILGLC